MPDIDAILNAIKAIPFPLPIPIVLPLPLPIFILKDWLDALLAAIQGLF
ncbi:MAG: hypothetical protein LBS96_08650 [Oscillospiraceae bacterium]|jgi:hypothetical protein|nr:hypothetical protein [Oscillospiraceae bacterium]